MSEVPRSGAPLDVESADLELADLERSKAGSVNMGSVGLEQAGVEPMNLGPTTTGQPAGPGAKPSYLEALEPEPVFALEMFGEHIDLVRRYTVDLARRCEELGLIGPLELPRLWTRHIINCGLIAPLLRPGRVGDVGSGAGLPGLVLAAARPDCHLVLIEPMERRVAWLESEAAGLGLSNVTVVRARAEDARLDAPLDQVTARAVTALTKLIPATVRLVEHGGEMVFMKGARVSEEMLAAKNIIRKHHLMNAEVLVLGEGLTTELTRVFRATVD